MDLEVFKGCSSVWYLSPEHSLQAIAALGASAINGFLCGVTLMKTQNPLRWSTLSTCRFPSSTPQAHPGFPPDPRICFLWCSEDEYPTCTMNLDMNRI